VSRFSEKFIFWPASESFTFFIDVLCNHLANNWPSHPSQPTTHQKIWMSSLTLFNIWKETKILLDFAYKFNKKNNKNSTLPLPPKKNNLKIWSVLCVWIFLFDYHTGTKKNPSHEKIKSKITTKEEKKWIVVVWTKKKLGIWIFWKKSYSLYYSIYSFFCLYFLHNCTAKNNNNNNFYIHTWRKKIIQY
jgi:hypothetical protein